jgi:N-methylhydantoinase A/oxoprolinase/acetone carboxylase beta subunit
VRLCLPSAQCLPPRCDWPPDLADAVGEHTFLAHGGVEFDGSPISTFMPEEIAGIGREIHARGITAIAVSGVFAPVRADYERQAGEILAASCPGAAITLSSDIGQLGLLERESATILNSALSDLAKRTVTALRQGVRAAGFSCPMYLSQNDGTLLDAERAQRFPVLTFASGPTNSMRGAGFLTGRSEAVVLDVGGTTTDVGLLQHGFPRQAATIVDIGGVRTNFRMPNIFSVGLGGGSLVTGSAGAIRVGPQSVGYELTHKARVFGGDILTTTDIAVAAGSVQLGTPSHVTGLDPQLVRECLEVVGSTLAAAVERSRISAAPIPVIAVGGGSILVPQRLAGLEVIRPENFAVANAIGAAIAQVSGEVDRIYSLGKLSREAALAQAEDEARRKALASGALPDTLVVTEREDVPLAYLRGDATRVRVKVVGEMGI